MYQSYILDRHKKYRTPDTAKKKGSLQNIWKDTIHGIPVSSPFVSLFPFSPAVCSVYIWGGRDEGYVIWHMAWQERHDIKREEGEKNGKGRGGGYDDTEYGFVRTVLHSARLRKQHMGKESWKGEKGGKRSEPRFSLFSRRHTTYKAFGMLFLLLSHPQPTPFQGQKLCLPFPLPLAELT